MKSSLIISLFGILFFVTFLAMVISFIPEDRITFTNLDSHRQSSGPAFNQDDPYYGSTSPQVLVYLFGDFSNASTNVMVESLKELSEKYGSIAIVWKDFPNTSLDPESITAAVAAQCAHKQEAFWDFQTILSPYADRLNADLYSSIAQELDLWQWSFERCVRKQKTMEMVQKNIEEGNALSVTAAPTVFINGERYTGLLTKSELEAIMASSLQDQ